MENHYRSKDQHTVKTLLIVDDEPAIRLLLKQFFQKKYEVVLLDDGIQAMEWLESHTETPVMILDLNMPAMSGGEVIMKVRVSEQHKTAPIIILSARESSQDRILCLRIGADDYVVKPFNPEEVDARIDAILRRM
jgi:DNA-binding response OmpR family regulator